YLDIVFPSPTLARNSLGSKEALTLFLTKAPLFLLARAALSPDEGRARRRDYSDSTAQMKIRLVGTVPERSAVANWGNGTPGGILPSHVSVERASRGYERAAGGYGGLPLRRVLRGDGSQARGAGPTRQGVGASHLCVRRVWP